MITLRRTMGFAMLTTALCVGWIAGCHEEKPPVEPATPIPDGGPPPDAAPVVTAPPAPAVTPCDAVQLAALTTMFAGRQKDEAPGMQAEGAPTCSVLPDGQSATSQIFTLQQGYCYTILGASLPTVSEVDMQLELDLTSGAPLPPALGAIKPILLTDTDAGPNASMGAKQNCYQWAFPIPAAVRVTIKSRVGTGPVAAQVFKKKKF